MPILPREIKDALNEYSRLPAGSPKIKFDVGLFVIPTQHDTTSIIVRRSYMEFYCTEIRSHPNRPFNSSIHTIKYRKVTEMIDTFRSPITSADASTPLSLLTGMAFDSLYRAVVAEACYKKLKYEKSTKLVQIESGPFRFHDTRGHVVD